MRSPLNPSPVRYTHAYAGLVLSGFNKNIILSAYADNIIVMVQNQKGVDILSSLTNSFNVLSSVRVNWKKSKAHSMLVSRVTVSQNLCWRKDGFKYLGVFLGDENTVRRNWEGIPASQNRGKV